MEDKPKILSHLSDDEIQDIYKYIDRCNIYTSHFDLAVLLHKIFKNKLRYCGKNKWQYLDNDKWQTDQRNKIITNWITSDISDLFLKRYFIWQANKSSDVYESMIYDDRVNNLLKLSYNFKKSKFIYPVLKEARGFFDIHNDD